MVQYWEVVGGAGKGGILARRSSALDSEKLEERVACGALLEELDLVGERLHFRLVAGDGPNEGWVSLRLAERLLVTRTRRRPLLPSSPPAAVEVADNEHEKEVTQQASLTCIKGHPLRPDFRAANTCDCCDKIGGTAFRCSQGCDYDLCTPCYEQAAAKASLPNLDALAESMASELATVRGVGRDANTAKDQRQGGLERNQAPPAPAPLSSIACGGQPRFSKYHWRRGLLNSCMAARNDSVALQEVQRNARAKLRGVEDRLHADTRPRRRGKGAERGRWANRAQAGHAGRSDSEGSDSCSSEDGVTTRSWHCDVCGKKQAASLRPEAGVGMRHCVDCKRQWESGWAAARECLSGDFEAAQQSDGEVVGLCRLCGLPLGGELAFDDGDAGATLHEECMTSLKLLEVRIKEEARERDTAEKKKAQRAEYDLGWSLQRLPKNNGLARKLGCDLNTNQGMCCLVLEKGGNEPEQVRVVETSEPAACINLEYLSLALQVRLHEGREPLFSLDPVERPKDPERAMQVKHFEPEWLMGTSAGEVMFQADYHLKELSMGEYEQPVVGMKSMFDFSEAECDSHGWSAREWFTVKSAEVWKTRDEVLLPHVEMSVEAREQVEGPNGLVDKKHTRPDHPMVLYAEEFTHFFDLIAERKSVVFHLRELAKASVLAKFLIDSQVRLEDTWFGAVDWAKVRKDAGGCHLEVPQLWHDRHKNRIQLYSGVALGSRQGVTTRTHSVYGGVAMGLDRFHMTSARPVASVLRAGASLTATVTNLRSPSLLSASRRYTQVPVASVAGGVMARTFGTRDPRTGASLVDPRGVDLNLDNFDLSEAKEVEFVAPERPVVGNAFWAFLDAGESAEGRPAAPGKAAEQNGFSDVAMLREVFNSSLSDRREEGDLFVGPETSSAYMGKLRQLVAEEAKIQAKRKEEFYSKDFVPEDPGSSFPTSWVAKASLGPRHSTRALRPCSDDVDAAAWAIARAATVSSEGAAVTVFDRCTEDGQRFRIYRCAAGVEARSVQAPGCKEELGAVFLAAGQERAGKVDEGEAVARVTQYVSAAVPEVCSPEERLTSHCYFVVLETDEGNLIATEKLRNGMVTWEENPVDLMERVSRARVVAYVDAGRAGLNVADVRKYRDEQQGSSTASASQCKSYVEGVYSRAWAFGADTWRRVADAVHAPPADVEIQPGQRDPNALKQARLAALGRTAEELRADPELALRAVQVDGLGLERAAKDLKANPKIVTAAVTENGTALKYAAASLRGDRAIVMSAVAADARALEHASDQLKADREIAFQAVKGNSFAINFAAENMRADRDLILASVHKNELAVEHASESLKRERAFNIAAVTKNAWALEHVPEVWRADREFMSAVVKHNAFALKYASEELRADVALVLTALEQDARAVEYADRDSLDLRPDWTPDELRETLRARLHSE